MNYLSCFFPVQSKRWEGIYDPIVQQRKVGLVTDTKNANGDVKMELETRKNAIKMINNERAVTMEIRSVIIEF